MKKIWHLSTCDTCRDIMKKLGGLEDFEKQDIKQKNISAKDLDQLKEKVGSYEALFSRRALKYKEMGLKDKLLTEDDYRRLILEEYTFLKRPVIVNGRKVYVGNASSTVEQARKEILEK
jgi:arsenate reductase